MKFTGERFVPSKYGMIALQHYHRYEFASHLIDFTDKTVLDVACGEGYGTNLMAPHSREAYGVDISEETIQSAKKTYPDEKIHFLVGNVTNIPLKDQCVDIVASFETIEHHDKHVEMIMEIKRILRRDGILIISSPNRGYYEKHFPDFKNEFHVKELYKSEFETLLQRYFKNYYSFTQNNVFGSVITCDADYTRTFSMPLHIDRAHGTIGFFEPRFNIAVVSDRAVEFNVTTSFCTYGSESDPFTEIEYKKYELQNIYNSKQWKIISWIKKPHGFLTRFFKK
jgi:ubiquinone/menaquinone biosynthesis C-methylase UbiE